MLRQFRLAEIRGILAAYSLCEALKVAAKAFAENARKEPAIR
jgi:hypothetical protein